MKLLSEFAARWRRELAKEQVKAGRDLAKQGLHRPLNNIYLDGSEDPIVTKIKGIQKKRIKSKK